MASAERTRGVNTTHLSVKSFLRLTSREVILVCFSVTTDLRE